MITALPDVQSIELQEGDDFFVLACDGIWNSKTNQQVVDLIRPRLSQSMPLSKICEEVSDSDLYIFILNYFIYLFFTFFFSSLTNALLRIPWAMAPDVTT